jgi:pseudouridine-5'-phosphate glycosidase
MKNDFPAVPVHLSAAVRGALQQGQPVVALESTVITHGLPYPENLTLAREMEAEVLPHGATPATIGVLEGRVYAGLEDAQLAALAGADHLGNRLGSAFHKISSRDFGPAIALGWSGGTTVAATLVVAQRAGMRVFATGGIGGVHRAAPGEQAFDISADLELLGRTPLIVVCAGAKAILDLPATLEVLESNGVPVVGYQTDDFPAFYSVSSGLPVSARADSPAEIAAIARAHWGMGQPSAVLVGNPPPAADALAPEAINGIIAQALGELHEQGIRGQAVTPFLLARVSQLSDGASLHTNLGLLKNNARLAAQGAVELSRHIAGRAV